MYVWESLTNVQFFPWLIIYRPHTIQITYNVVRCLYKKIVAGMIGDRVMCARGPQVLHFCPFDCGTKQMATVMRSPEQYVRLQKLLPMPIVFNTRLFFSSMGLPWNAKSIRSSSVGVGVGLDGSVFVWDRMGLWRYGAKYDWNIINTHGNSNVFRRT